MNISLNVNGQELELHVDLIEDKNQHLTGLSFANKKTKEVLITLTLDTEFSIVDQEISQKVQEPEERLKDILESTILQVISLRKEGIEQTEEEDSIEEVPFNPEDIKIRTQALSLRHVYDMIEGEDLDLNPEFQRYFVWDRKRQSRLIESILQRIPLPMFYCAEDKDGRLSVIDGLQRLTSIKSFMDNAYALKNLEYLESCEGKYYTTKDEQEGIPTKFFRWFNLTNITVGIIEASSPDRVKYDLFRRINTGGRALNNQEIRNSLAKPIVRELLRNMAHSEIFQQTTDRSIRNTRMDAEEMALRFILFYDLFKCDEKLSDYNGNMTLSLDQKIDDLGKKSGLELLKYQKLYEQAMKNAFYLFGKYAFRKCKPEHLREGARKQLINKALFVVWSVVLADKTETDIQNNYAPHALLQPLAQAIADDSKFYNYLTIGTNAKANMFFTYQKAVTLLETQA